jgi:hypothetical protein
MLHFWLRGTPQGADQTFELQLWAVFDFDHDDLMTNERVYVDRPSADVKSVSKRHPWSRQTGR